jgi:hypothetical protein
MYELEDAPYAMPWPFGACEMSDLPPADPDTWDIIKEAAVALVAAMAAVISSLALIVFNGIRASIRTLRQDLKEADTRVVKLETERSEVAIMNTKMSSLADLMEQSQARIEAHHRDNRETMDRDREATRRWREETMQPTLEEMKTKLAVLEQRTTVLEKRRRR